MRYSYEYKKKCVELYRQGKWPETPDGVKEKRFHDTVRIWVRIEDACGPEALRHKNQNKVWTVEEKYELLPLSRSSGVFGDSERDFVFRNPNRHPSATSNTIITLKPTAKNLRSPQPGRWHFPLALPSRTSRRVRSSPCPCGRRE